MQGALTGHFVNWEHEEPWNVEEGIVCELRATPNTRWDYANRSQLSCQLDNEAYCTISWHMTSTEYAVCRDD